MTSTRLNPLSRLARRKRLNVAIKGPSGSGKSRFAASMSALTGVAGIGKLAPFDTERKMRLNYALFTIDSWDDFYGPRGAEMRRAIRAETGDPTAALVQDKHA